MKNHQDDILKQFLQDTFSDYEPEPREQSWENIFSAIQPSKPTFWGKSKPWIASILVILTSAWLWYSSVKVEANTLESGRVNTITTDESTTIQQSDDSQTDIAPSWLVKTKAEKTQQSDDSQTDSSPYLLVKTKAEKTQQSDDSQTDASPNLLVKIKAEKTQQSDSKTDFLPTAEKETIVSSNTPKVARGNHPTVEKQSDEAVVLRDNLTASTSERMETFITDMNINNIEKVRYILPIESIKNKDIILSKIEVNTPSILPIIAPTREAKPIRQHTYLSLSITPLQTYRILTINNPDVQNVQTNNLFDSERNGWQFEAGLVKPIGRLWNLRANISYLKMRQWSEYQVNTDELVLRNTNTVQRSNTLEALGQTITESKTLQMVGLKADLQRFFKITGRNRYFVSMGTQLMYETQEQQTNIFINASAGFQHVVNSDLLVTIEPTASYLLYNINDPKSLIQTNAYNLGLKVGVNFKVK